MNGLLEALESCGSVLRRRHVTALLSHCLDQPVATESVKGNDRQFETPQQADVIVEPEPTPETIVSVVVVHGIGQQVQGQTLLDWAEPLARRFERLASESGGGARIHRSSIISPTEPGIDIDVHVGARLTRVEFTEARWAAAFLTLSPTSVLWWSARYAVSAALRTAAQVLRLFGLLTFKNEHHPRRFADADVRSDEVREPLPTRPRWWTHVRDFLFGFIVGFAGAVLVYVYYFAFLILCLAAAGVLVLFIPFAWIALLIVGILARIPGIGKPFSAAVTALATTIGDAAAWVDAPLRAEAMSEIVKDRVTAAHRHGADRVVVLAHSQGAAVAVHAILSMPLAARPDVLVTIGGATSLLRSPVWGEGGAQPEIVQGLAGSEVRWINIWALLDPVPAGPLGDSRKASRIRWNWLRAAGARIEEEKNARLRAASGVAKGTVAFDKILGDDDVERAALHNEELLAAMTEVAGDRARTGPEEWVVDNGLSLFSDHVRYSANQIEVVEPMARVILGVELDDVDRNGRRALERRRLQVGVLFEARLFSFLIAAWVAPLFLQLPAPLSVTRDFLGAAAKSGGFWGWVSSVAGSASVLPVLAFVVTVTIVFLTINSVISLAWSRADEALSWRPERWVRGLLPFWIVCTVLSVVLWNLVYSWVARIEMGILAPWIQLWLVVGGSIVFFLAPNFRRAIPALRISKPQRGAVGAEAVPVDTEIPPTPTSDGDDDGQPGPAAAPESGHSG